MKKLISKLRAVPLKKKLQAGAAAVVTLAFAAAFQSYAWFAEQKKAAEMFKIKHPDSLYLNAAHQEDQVYFNLGNIQVYLQDESGNFIDENGNILPTGQTPIKASNKYVFSVSGSNTTAFTIQLAYTTNNDLDYKVFEATEYEYPKGTDETNDAEYNAKIVPEGTNNNKIVSYESNVSDTPKTYYYVKGDQVNLIKKNADSTNTQIATACTTDKYYNANYDTYTNVHENAVPLYEQGTFTVGSSAEFCRYFILEVSRSSESTVMQLDKETDIVYISVEKTSS